MPATEHKQPVPLEPPLPGEGLDAARMPGHWLLARLGKRVLRPGGVELTRWMLYALGVDPEDRVVELTAGLGATARLTLRKGRPARTEPRAAPAPDGSGGPG